MEVRINKEVRNYQESLFFGLSLRQFLFALLAVLVALAVYFCLRPVLGTGEIGWVCILAAFPWFGRFGAFCFGGERTRCWSLLCSAVCGKPKCMGSQNRMVDIRSGWMTCLTIINQAPSIPG